VLPLIARERASLSLLSTGLPSRGARKLRSPSVLPYQILFLHKPEEDHSQARKGCWHSTARCRSSSVTAHLTAPYSGKPASISSASLPIPVDLPDIHIHLRPCSPPVRSEASITCCYTPPQTLDPRTLTPARLAHQHQPLYRTITTRTTNNVPQTAPPQRPAVPQPSNLCDNLQRLASRASVPFSPVCTRESLPSLTGTCINAYRLPKRQS
jgi:hypothetical protein